MPNGVICGGAVDGSNQLGAIVTCQAMTACPDGAGSPAHAELPVSQRIAASNRPMSPGWRHRTRKKSMLMPPPAGRSKVEPITKNSQICSGLQRRLALGLKTVHVGKATEQPHGRLYSRVAGSTVFC